MTTHEQYAVLIDTGGDWPDVIFVGSYDQAREIHTRDFTPFVTSLQAVVSPGDVLAHVKGLDD